MLKRKLRLEDFTNFIGNSVLVKVFPVLCLLISLLPTLASAVSLWQIEEYKAKKEVDPLIAALSDEDWRVRMNAVWALGKIGNAKAVEPLIAALRDAYVRSVAAEALDKIDPEWQRSDAAKRQVPEFIAALRVKDNNVRIAAVETLVKIDPKWPKKWLKSDAVKKQVPEFITALRAQDHIVRRYAAEVLGEIGDVRVLEQYAQRVRGSGPLRDVASLVTIFDHFSPFEKIPAIIKILGALYSNVWLHLLSLISGAGLFPFLKKMLERLFAIKARLPGNIVVLGTACSLTIPIIPVLVAKYYFIHPLFNFRLMSSIFLLIPMIIFFFAFLLVFLLFLSAIPAFNSAWLKAKKEARHFFCPLCLHRRFELGPGLPWIVRWSGRILAEEKPERYDSFEDYFVCGTCGKEEKVRIDRIVGTIGADIIALKEAGKQVYLDLWSEQEKKARNADIDVLEIINSPGISYDYAINAVLVTLKNDTSRPSDYVKGIPVVIKENTPISEESMRVLKQEFGGIQRR